MNIQSIIHGFMQSEQGQQAAAELANQGFDEGQVQQILHHSAHAGAEHVEAHHRDNGGLFGEHAGLSFFAAFASGLIKGDGVVGALEDGAAGIVIARITEALTAQVGLDSAAADAAAAATAPYVMSFLKQHLGI